MKINVRIIYIAITSFLVFGCTKEELIPRSYPITKTLNPQDNTTEGITFRGEVAYSTVEIIDHGFVWSESQDPAENPQTISLGPRSGIGVFEARRDWGFKKGKTYYVWAYAKSADHTVYGNQIGFISEGGKLPVIKSFFPTEATWDDVITIVGENFSEENKHNVVIFGEYGGTVIKCSRDTVFVKVPAGVTDESLTLSLTYEENKTIAYNQFKLKRPIIESVTPNAAQPGTKIVIRGKYLMSYSNVITFDGRKAQITGRSPDALECVVPNGVMGLVTLQLVTGTGNLWTTTSFNVLP